VGGAALATAGFERTSRGTALVVFHVWSSQTDVALASGSWTFELTSSAEALEVHGRVGDYYSGWSRGVRWERPTVDRSTICYPATADSAFGVGAYAGRLPGDSPRDDAEPGELRGFSGRGPRIDGRQVVDLAAPDDPLVPLGVSAERLEQGWGRSWYFGFGGTSGAAPQLAGALAWLASRRPDDGPDAWLERLIDGARPRPAGRPADTPDLGWGWGQLDILEALELEAAALDDNSSPEAHLELRVVDSAEDPSGFSLELDASASSDAESGALQYRFDYDYDGRWDTDWADQPVAQMSGPDGALRWLSLVEIRDELGAHDRASASIVLERPDDAGHPDAGHPDAGGLDAPPSVPGDGRASCASISMVPARAGADGPRHRGAGGWRWLVALAAALKLAARRRGQP
jgi:hypothetical protein